MTKTAERQLRAALDVRGVAGPPPGPGLWVVTVCRLGVENDDEPLATGFYFTEAEAVVAALEATR